jgi:hypothetical protein
MLTFYKRSGIFIPKEYRDTSFYGYIKQFLTRKNKDYQTGKTTDIEFFDETEEGLLIPRYFPINSYIRSFDIINEVNKGKDIDIKHNIIPREGQKEVMDYLINNDSCLIKVPPGGGKTTMTIYAIAERKKRALVLVHNTTLLDQWYDRVEQFTNLKKNDILLFSTPKAKNVLDDYPIVISTVQTICSMSKTKREYLLELFTEANFGILIADEAHTTAGAPRFSKASLHINVPITIGLSATPLRFDKNHDIIELHMGNIFTPESDLETMPTKIYVIMFKYGIYKNKKKKYISWGGRFIKSRYLKFIYKTKRLLDIYDAILNKCYSEDRNILSIIERIDFIEEISKRHKEKNITLFIGKNGKEHLSGKIVLATPQRSRDGLDISWKDTLIMPSPIGNCEQAIGRIRRIQKDKKTPIVFDLVDIECKAISDTFYHRKKYYQKMLEKGWEINYILINDDNKKIILNEKEALQILNNIG